MSQSAAPLRVGWKLASANGSMASVRYRALLPVLALRDLSVRSSLFTGGNESHLEGIDVLVIVKSWTAEDIWLAQKARQRGIPVVFDLCDNVFIDSYRSLKAKLLPRDVLRVMAPLLAGMVVTTLPLARAVEQHLPGLPVHIVPDGIETPDLFRQSLGLIATVSTATEPRWRMLRRRAGSLLHHVREDPGVMLPLAVHLSRKLAGATLRRAGLMRRPVHQAPVPEGPLVRPTEDERPLARHCILWFGNHGASHASFGMLDLLEFREALEAIAREADVELVVVSNHPGKFDKHILPMLIPTRYVEWSPAQAERWLQRASVVVVPNSLDDFSVCKSANRTVKAVCAGIPVVATPTPALEPMQPYVHVGDPLTGLRRYLADPETGRRDALAAAQLARQAFAQPAIGGQWLQVLQKASGLAGGAPVETVECAVVLHLVQDLDLALPILRALLARGVQAQAWCSASLVGRSPRVIAHLQAASVPLRVLSDDPGASAANLPSSLRSLLTVAETSLSPHRFPRRLTLAAKAQGIRVGTLQHGYENVGLTYSDDVHAIEQVDIAADRIYLWGPLETLHPEVSASVRARCVPVGCPKPAVVPALPLAGLVPAGMPVIGVFENLHWHRYDDAYRQSFLAAVRALAGQFPQICVLVKPHHGGMWLTGRYAGDKPAAPNIVIADPALPAWEHSTAGALLGSLAAVITTPSTVALDAARLGLPCAVFAAGLDLPQYTPLPLLSGSAACRDFVREVLQAEDGGLRAASAAFAARVVLPGDAATRIAADLTGP